MIDPIDPIADENLELIPAQLLTVRYMGPNVTQPGPERMISKDLTLLFVYYIRHASSVVVSLTIACQPLTIEHREAV